MGERVYPILAEKDPEIPALESGASGWTAPQLPEIPSDLFTGLSNTMADLNQEVSKLGSVADAAGATNEYADRIRSASSKIENLNQSYSVAVDSIYELELQDAKTHLKSLNQFYGAMTEAMSSMSEATKDAQQYRDGMAQLNQNLQRLNNVYGNMLSAMAGGTR